ncbi:MAG: Response regulator [Candidatus Collierbacteria bacterium GW2011_GWC2_43_12]|uniref:Response regulator n=1 Tax=Candidatus Collierbacteria bacterium GW2011_GWC2_43_12 TaxID=1618390 RepID=A0A0G1D4N1_9BACT|nr:MAG: Response regulator [Candidatus Collierbacteria bacterium GW2011_GWC2_43_12]
MADINLIKIENRFDKGSLSFLNPRNWFRKKYTKENTNILFIDDEDMPVVDNLKKAGYRVKKVRDVKDVDDAEVQSAQLIFVDYRGVGKNISQTYEGLGLAERLVDTYKNKKRIILYSAYNFSSDVALNEIFNKVHNRISKNSDTSEFMKLIELEISRL